MDERTIANVVELLREAARPTKIIIFGSHARGDARQDSDIDILVVEGEVADRAAEMVRLDRVLSPLRIPVDLLVVSDEMLRDRSSVLGNVCSEAAREGRIVFEAA